MLPSSGYFRNINCPFFSNGLCERPHCHFRHVSAESYGASLPTATAAAQPLLQEAVVLPTEASISFTSKPDLLLLVREAILQVQKEVVADKGAAGNELPLSGSAVSNVSPLLTTELSGLSSTSKAAIHVGLPFVHQQPRPPAEYRPTPIAQLRKLQSQSAAKSNAITGCASEYEPCSKTTSKNLYVPESRSRLPSSAANVSYIPNPIKKVPSKKQPVVSIASDSDSDADVGIGGAAFSDEDGVTADVQTTKDDDLNRESCSVKCNTSGVEVSAPLDSGSGPKFDLVNQILTESVAFDSLLARRSTAPDAEKKPPKHVICKGSVGNGSGPTALRQSTKKAQEVSKQQKLKDKSTSCLVKKSTTVNVPSKQTKHSGNLATNSQKKATATPVLASKLKLKQVSAKTKVQVNGSSSSSVEGTSKSVKTKQQDSSKVAPTQDKVKGQERKTSVIASVKRPAALEKTACEPQAKKVKTVENKAVPTAKTEVPSSAWPALSETSDTIASNVLSTAHVKVDLTLMPDTSEDQGSDLEDDDDEDEDNDVDEECLKIFNEYTPHVDPEISSAKKAPEKSNIYDAEVTIPGKVRVARDPNLNLHPVRRNVFVAKYKASPSQIMYERFLRVQQMVMEGREKSTSTSLPDINVPRSKTVRNEHSMEVGKQRVAHVPNGTNTPSIKTLSNRGTTAASTSLSVITPKTAAATNAKGNQRVSHLPKNSSFVRPTIPAEFGSKVPTNIRQKYLNFIINECMAIYDTEQDASERGLVEEKMAYDRSPNRAVYLNVVANAIKKLREEQPKDPKSTDLAVASASKQRVVSHQFNLGGKKAANVSYSIERVKNKCSDASIMSGVHLYKTLKRYILSEEQLVQNGFPLAHPTEPNVTVIIKQSARRNSTDPMDKVCTRCGSTFKVAEAGTYLTKEECFYHWGRAHKVRNGGGYETRYSCCQAGLHSEGCCVGRLHVYDDIDPYNLRGFVKTLPKSPPPDDNYGVFALDCEMCYTNMGNELTRITVVDSNSKPVFESLVKPENPIIDYNTRFSGITEADLKDVQTTLRDVQAIILNKFSDRTILIGHSLESDFKALKLIHKTVVDTSVVFPHKLGPPYKRALRTLVAEHLKKIIQNDVGGHDSQEDAASCMQLMLWKTKEDLKMVY